MCSTLSGKMNSILTYFGMFVAGFEVGLFFVIIAVKWFGVEI